MMPKGTLAPIPVRVGVTFGPPVPLRPDDDKSMFLRRAHDALEALMSQGGTP